jgi:ABC-type nickel/cobalt efflux system permease component RcnA
LNRHVYAKFQPPQAEGNIAHATFPVCRALQGQRDGWRKISCMSIGIIPGSGTIQALLVRDGYGLFVSGVFLKRELPAGAAMKPN